MGFSRVGIAKASADVTVGYADFIRLCNVRDVNDWLPGLRVAFDGVWVREQSDHLAHLEHSILTEHPDGNPSVPVLTFPCTLGEIEERVVDFYGNNGFIDPFELAEFVASASASRQSEPKASEGLGSRERNNLLRVIATLMKSCRISLEPRQGGVKQLTADVAAYPFDTPKEATIRDIIDQVKVISET